MDSTEAQFLEYAVVFEALDVLALAFLFAVVSESVWDVVTGQRKKLGETFANGAIAIILALLERTAYGLIFIVALLLVTPFAVFEIPQGWWTLPLAVLAADFTYYWMHRCEHEVRLFWANHSVHHSSPEFNFTTALRISWMDAIIEWVFFVPMILLGFGLVPTVAGLVVVVAYQSWVHTEKVGRLGWLDQLMNTPSIHRVHHGSNAQYIDKNYGGILIIWDRIFGTYAPENETVKYGITTPIGSQNPFTINFREYTTLLHDVRRAESWKSALGYMFRPPGWQPENSGKSKENPQP
ncbi:sterol desaturase family protein [Ruegeria sp. EL01]|jgi:sterol desaturase/sphingolipid hydroxylase (fatty acid hydroxylase superfamily)|uniref:sterol desaturase family protein n=1 Tax=Ruegeria sp. EL01 TaxID=2107578 RepID=UPI000EA82333|nr:sterol desaturase family protein [Ruegeria sp. EL01]